MKHYPNKNATGQLLEELHLHYNDISSEGMAHVMKIVETSKLHALLTIDLSDTPYLTDLPCMY